MAFTCLNISVNKATIAVIIANYINICNNKYKMKNGRFRSIIHMVWSQWWVSRLHNYV